MIPPRGLNAYRQTEVQSRTPLELVVMLYDGALRFLGNAKEAIARNDIRGRRDGTTRALAIISELQSTLDLERGGELAASLDDLYDYMSKRIMDAAIKNDAKPISEVETLLLTLRDGWQAIASTAMQPAAVAATSVPSSAPLRTAR